MYRIAVFTETVDPNRLIYSARISHDKKKSLPYEGCILIHEGVSYLVTLKENKEVFRFTCNKSQKSLPTLLIPFEMEKDSRNERHFIYSQIRLFVDQQHGFHLSIKRKRESVQVGKIPGVSHWKKISDTMDKVF